MSKTETPLIKPQLTMILSWILYPLFPCTLSYYGGTFLSYPSVFRAFSEIGKAPCIARKLSHIRAVHGFTALHAASKSLLVFIIVPLSLEMLCKICVESIANSSHHEHG
jgi:ACR3 family arsenite efflux pump ArsB